MPKIIRVSEKEWAEKVPTFDQYTALRAKNAGPVGLDDEDGNGSDNDINIYDFYVNVDNKYLKHELKHSKKEVELSQAQFINGLVLIGLGLLHEASLSKNSSEENGRGLNNGARGNVEDLIDLVTIAVAPILLPMIDSLGELRLDEN